MDIRTFGKGYEQFYHNAQAMGIEFVKGKVAAISQDEEQNPVVHLELIEEGSQIVDRRHDLVVLSLGMVPGYQPQSVYQVTVAEEDGFVAQPAPHLFPALTERPGIFVAGTAAGPMDIVDSIILAGAAASETAAYLNTQNGHGGSARVPLFEGEPINA
jgi:heterodisulfide reductase subunit A